MKSSLGNMGKNLELRRRVIFSLAMLAVYRFGIFVSTPGIDTVALKNMFERTSGTLFGLVNLFSGGALENFSIFTLGITPYISVSIIMQLLATSVPSLEALKKQGETGQRIITRYTRQGTVLLALFQSYMIAVGLESKGVVLDPGFMFRLTTMITLTTGTAFIMWLGEQITERGLGNGTSIIIFGGIVARMPATFISTVALARTGELNPLVILGILVFAAATVAFIVFVERSARKIPVQYPRRMVGKMMAQAQTQYLPLKVNMAGVIPPIFASAFLVVPATIASFSQNETLLQAMEYLHPGTWTYSLVFVVLIVLFCYFYVATIFNPTEIAENLKKNGGFVPLVRPGKETADYFYAVLNRLTLWGALYISAVCIVPQLIYLYFGAAEFSHIFGGTAVLIVVGVTLDTISQIESHIVSQNYEAYMSQTAKMQGGMAGMSMARARALKR